MTVSAWPRGARALLLAGSFLLGAVAARADGWRHWDFEGLSFDAPAELKPFDGKGPGPIGPGTREWGGLPLTPSPGGAVERSLFVHLSWGDRAEGYAASGSMKTTVMDVVVAGRAARRIEFVNKDQYNDQHGIDVVITEPTVYGKRLALTCRGPSKKWATHQTVCDRIVDSLVIREAPPGDGGTVVVDGGAATGSPPIGSPPSGTPSSGSSSGKASPPDPTGAPSGATADASPPTPPDSAKPTLSPPEGGKPTATPQSPPGPVTIAPTGRRVALVIGNGAYRAAPKLPTPAMDAARMKAKLTALGFEVIASADLARSGMTGDLAAFYAKAKGAEVALFYFSGHGIQVRGHNYLLPTDADFSEPGAALDVEARAVDLEKFLQAAGEAKTVLAFIDACRDNPVVEEKLAQTFYKGLGGPTKGLAVIPKEQVRPNQFIVFASEEGKTAETGAADVSVFTAALLDNLGRPGEDIALAYRKIRSAVESATGGRQSPRSVDDLRNEMVLAPVK